MTAESTSRGFETLRAAGLLGCGFAMFGLVARGLVAAWYPAGAAAFPGNAVAVPLFLGLGGFILLANALKRGERRVSGVQKVIFALAGLAFVGALGSAILSPLAWAWPLGLPVAIILSFAGLTRSRRLRLG
jgi:hypothetical protein